MVKQQAIVASIGAAVLLVVSACATRPQPEQAIRWLPDCEGRPISGLDPEVVSRTQCGIATVPLDHLKPRLGNLKLDITRVAALEPQKRAGALFTNPGGPGADGSGFAVVLASLWKSYADMPDGEAYQHLTNTYDIIGITPRGLGSTPDAQLVCQSDEIVVAQNDIAEDRSAANIEAIRHNAGVLARGCASQRMAPYINTEQTARDMEFVRIALKEPTLNYFGNSYGTWLGAWYAGLFPEHVGRMVLDSNTDWTSTFQNASLIQAPEKERIFTRFVAQRAAENPKAYQMGNDPRAIGEIFTGLLPQVRVALRSDSEFYSSIEYLMAARALSDWLRRSPELKDAQLHKKASAYRFSPDPDINQQVQRAFTHLLSVTRNPAPWNDIAPGPLKLSPAVSVRSTVLCNDSPAANDAFWTEKENQYAARYPVGGSFFQARHCAGWRAKPLAGVPLGKLAQADSIVMVQAEYDGQTPASGAFNAFRSLPNTRLVLLKGVHQHGVSFADLSACVNRNVGEYLAYGRKPDRIATCFASD